MYHDIGWWTTYIAALGIKDVFTRQYELNVGKCEYKMAAKARFESNKDFIMEKLNVTVLFEYLVKHGYMDCSLKDRIVRNPSEEVNKNMYKLLSKYVNDSDDVIDNLFFNGLMATGQSDIVLKIFPDFKKRSFSVRVHRITMHRRYIENNVDMVRLKKYIDDNKMCVPEYRGTRTHEMKTRSQTKSQTCQKPLWGYLTGRVYRDDFDFNTDALVQSLVKSGHGDLMKIVFPYILTRVHD